MTDTEGIQVEISATASSLVSEVGRALESMGLLEAAATSVGLVTASVFAEKSIAGALDYSSALEAVKTKAGLTTADVATLSSGIAALGQTAVGGQFSQTALASALVDVSREGRSASDSLTILSSAATLSKSTGTELGVSAGILDRLMAALGVSAKDSAGFVDILRKASVESNISVGDLADTLVTTSQTARTFGLSISQQAAILTTLAENGVQSPRVIAAAFEQMIRPSKEAADFFARFSISTQDADGNMRPLPDILNQIATHTDSVGASVSAVDINKAFGPQAGNALNVLVRNVGDLSSRTDAFTTSAGNARAAAEDMASSPQGRLDALNARLTDLGIAAGDVLLPPLVAVATVFDDFLTFIDDHLDIVVALGLAIGTVAVAANAGTLAFGAALAAQLALTTATEAATAVMFLFDASMLPLTLTVLAIAAAVGLLAIAWTNNFLGIRDLTANVVGWIGGILSEFGAFLNGTYLNLFRAWGAAIMAVFETIGAFFAAVWLTIKDIFTGNLSDIGNVWGAFGARLVDIWVTAWNRVTGFLGDAWQTIVNTFRGLPQAIVDAIGDIGSFLWDHLKTGLHNAAENLTQWAKGVLGLSPTLTEIGGYVPDSIAAGITANAGAVDTALKASLHTAADNATQFVRETHRQLVQELAADSANALDPFGGVGQAAWTNHLMTLQGDFNTQPAQPAAPAPFQPHTFADVVDHFGRSWQLSVLDERGDVQAAGGANGMLSGTASMLEQQMGLVAGGLKGIFQAANVPYLAAGGIVNSPTLAMIGEAGPEAVVPLSQMGNFGGGGDVVVIISPKDGLSDMLMAKVERRLVRGLKSAGL
jgi:TP901 family phage tail tape measure protein